MPRRFWKYFIYFIMAMYVLYVAMSMYYLNSLVQEGQDYSEDAGEYIRELRTRSRELTTVLPVMLASPELSLPEIQQKLRQSTQRQLETFEELKKLFRGPGEIIASLEATLDAIARSKQDAAIRLKNNLSYELSLTYYRHNLAPLLEKLQTVLDAAHQSVDHTRNQIHVKMHRRLNLVILFTVLAGMLILVVTIVYDRRMAKSSSELAYRNRLFKLLGSAVDEVFIIAKNSEMFEYVSSNCQRILGLSAHSLKTDPAPLYASLGREDADWVKGMLARPPAPGAHEERDITDSGENRHFKLRLYTIQPPFSHNPRVIMVINDQTETRQHQQALSDALENAHAASAAKSSFLSHMSHEIRTPMNAIIGMTTIALSRLGDRARVEDCLQKISGSSRHLLRLINDVLDMSKIESGKLAICNAPFNLPGLVENIQSTFQPQIQIKNQQFKILLKNVVTENLIGDAMRLNQILLNILSNAIKFTPDGGAITLEIEQQEKKGAVVPHRFTVSDTGIGITEEFLERIYKPFEQANAAVASKYGGTGLGMPITANLVAMMGGTIRVQSQLGAGTTFFIELPFELAEQSPAAQPGHFPQTQALLVDDDPDASEQACQILGKFGIDPVRASTAAQALETGAKIGARKEGALICLFNWHMGGLNPAAFCQQLRAQAPQAILVASSPNPAQIEAQAKEAGVDYLVARPYFPSTLLEVLQKTATQGGEDQAQASGNYDFSGRRILLAEDNEFNREIAKEFLEMANAELDFAVNGQEAVQKFMEAPAGYYDLILMDIQMPVMDGYEATRKIRGSTHPDASAIIIIATTANAFNEDVAKAIQAGMNAHIAKPIDINQLYAILAEYLGAKA